MARQARSEQTRRKIIAAAVDVFGEIGYSAAGLGDIIDRAEMTKGALYYHFDSKEALATAIIEEAGATLYKTFTSIATSSAPALESAIHGVFSVADALHEDRVARAGVQLLRTLAEFNPAAAEIYGQWLIEMTQIIERAISEGDVRTDVAADVVGSSIVSGMLGAELISSALGRGSELFTLVASTWELLLTAVVKPDALPYFKEYLDRESLRRQPQRLSLD